MLSMDVIKNIRSTVSKILINIDVLTNKYDKTCFTIIHYK